MKQKSRTETPPKIEETPGNPTGKNQFSPEEKESLL
jgi:hypothetical protein